MPEVCKTCNRQPGSRTPRCIRCAERGRDRVIPSCLPGRYLVVDAAATSGWCIAEGSTETADRFAPHLLDVGECSVWSRDPLRIAEEAAQDGCEALVIEVPAPAMGPAAGLGGHKTIMGLGKAIGVWELAWRLAHTRGVVLEVMTVAWRPVILGSEHRGAKEWKAAALKHCRSIYEHAGILDRITGTEIPDAVCLAEYALTSLDLADEVGPRRLGQLGWVEPRGAWVSGQWVPA